MKKAKNKGTTHKKEGKNNRRRKITRDGPKNGLKKQIGKKKS